MAETVRPVGGNVHVEHVIVALTLDRVDRQAPSGEVLGDGLGNTELDDQYTGVSEVHMASRNIRRQADYLSRALLCIGILSKSAVHRTEHIPAFPVGITCLPDFVENFHGFTQAIGLQHILRLLF